VIFSEIVTPPNYMTKTSPNTTGILIEFSRVLAKVILWDFTKIWIFSISEWKWLCRFSPVGNRYWVWLAHKHVELELSLWTTWGNEAIAPLILYRRTRWRWAISFTLWGRGKNPASIIYEFGWHSGHRTTWNRESEPRFFGCPTNSL